MRMLNSDDQAVPIFTGWQLNNRKKQILDFDKTVVTYLPPLPTKITDFQTIFKYLTYLQGLAITTNMPFVKVALDMGATMNCYQLIWNFQHYFSYVVIHLGHFHFLKENFLIIGITIQSSVFEDLAFQAGICTSGSIRSVQSGSHYKSMDSSQYFFKKL